MARFTGALKPYAHWTTAFGWDRRSGLVTSLSSVCDAEQVHSADRIEPSEHRWFSSRRFIDAALRCIAEVNFARIPSVVKWVQAAAYVIGAAAARGAC